MKRIFIFFGICGSMIGLPDARGQSTIAPSIINATGGTGTTLGYVCEWSVGEMTMVSTFTGLSVIVTQGVLQDDSLASTGVRNTGLAEQMQVFPNPASTVVNLRFTAVAPGLLGYRLMDITGQVITNASTAVKQGVTIEQVDISGLAAATYLLQVTFKPDGNLEQMTTYKIDKLK